MMSVLTSAPVKSILDMANTAAQVSPVPGVAVAVSALSAIVDGCEQVQVHKVRVSWIPESVIATHT
jgi:hypothetical protein